MACKSASVEKAEKKAGEAMEIIVKLRKKAEQKAKDYETTFRSRIAEFENQLGVDDFIMRQYRETTKVEFTHEFNLDQLVPAIQASIELLVNVLAPGSAAVNVLTSPESLKTYASLVNSIAQAAKTESKADVSTTFSVTPVAPGVYLFMSSSAATITDKETFGNESITATNIYYAVYTSNADMDVSDATLIMNIAEIILNLAKLKLDAIKMVAEGTMTMQQYRVFRAQIDEEINYERKKLAELELNDVAVVEPISAKTSNKDINKVMRMGHRPKFVNEVTKYDNEVLKKYISLLEIKSKDEKVDYSDAIEDALELI